MLRRLIALALISLTLGVSAQTRMISHVTSTTGGFTTKVIVENASVLPQTVTLTPYDRDGNLLPARDVEVAGLKTSFATTTDLFEGEVAYFLISDNDEVTVSVDYNFENSDSSPANVLASSEQASRWRLFPGNWDQVFDGVAVVNTSDVATDVWVHQKSADGQVILSRKVATGLAPNAKALSVLGSPDGSPFVPTADSYFELTADQNVAMTALRGTLVSAPVGLLWTNVSRALGHATSTRDDLGVFYIKDGSLYDVMETMGYLVAQDRLWQLELNRRTARGRMAELFGQSLFNNDLVIRRIAYSDDELAQEYADLDDETRLMIDGYLAGLNRHISEVNSVEKDVIAQGLPQSQSIMPYEFKVYNFQEIPYWDFKDILSWIATAQRNFTVDGLGFAQVNNLNLAFDLIDFTGDPVTAEAMFDDLRWVNDAKAPTMIPNFSVQKAKDKPGPKTPSWKLAEGLDMNETRRQIKEFSDMLDQNREELIRTGAFLKGGSFAWVVSGSNTESGNPVLYSGPQMGLGAPIAVVEGSIESDTYTASGMLVPGIPGVVVGRTPHHAWSFQVGHSHSFDYFRESPDTVTLHRTEIIKVAGGDDVEVPVYRSARGIVMTDMPWLSWVYAHHGYDFELSKGMLGLARAQNMDEFHTAVENLAVSQHILYADVDGNIAYWMSGRVPVRPEGNYKLPQGFAADPVEYDLDVLEPIPHDRNTPQGWYGGWNTKASVDADDPTGIHVFGPFQRGHIVQDNLAGQTNMSFEEIRDVVIDITHTTSFDSGGVLWTYVRDEFMAAVANNPTPERQEIVDLIEGWHLHFPEGPKEGWITAENFHEASLFQRQWILTTLINTFDDEMGPATSLREAGRRFNVLLHALDENPDVVNNYDWFQNADANAPQTAEANIIKGLDDAIANLGPRPIVISRGVLPYNHAVLGTLHQIPFASRSDYSQVVELGSDGPTRIESHIALGQSGRILTDDEFQPVLDPNYLSMCDMFVNFIHRPFPLFSATLKAKQAAENQKAAAADSK